MNPNLIETQLQLFQPEYQELITGNFPDITAQLYGGVVNFDKDNTQILENALRLYLLCLLNEEEFAMFVERNTVATKEIASNLVKNIISSLPEQFIKNLQQTRLHLRDTTAPQSEKTLVTQTLTHATSPTSAAPTPAHPSATSHQPTSFTPPIPLAGVRTMHSDAASASAAPTAQPAVSPQPAAPAGENEVVHNAPSQTDLLQKQPPPTPIPPVNPTPPPTPPTSSEPRWESDRSDS